MPTKFDVTVRLNIPREELWRIRASRSFMSFLVSNGALQRMDATPVEEGLNNNNAPTTTGNKKKKKNNNNKNNKRQRRQTYVPGDVIIPEVVKPIIDDSYIEIGDEQTWDNDIPYVQDSMIRPAVMGDVIVTKARLSLEEDVEDEGKCYHSLAGEVGVSLLFIGYYVEQAIVANMKSFYDNYPGHIDDFVHMVINKYGDGTRASLSKAIDIMLAEEKSL